MKKAKKEDPVAEQTPDAPTGLRPAQEVEARFVCTNKKILDERQVEVSMSASVAGRDNVDWAPYTPAGHVSLVCVPQAAALFVEGGRYALTIRRAELSDLHLAHPTETIGDQVTPGY